MEHKWQPAYHRGVANSISIYRECQRCGQRLYGYTQEERESLLPCKREEKNVHLRRSPKEIEDALTAVLDPLIKRGNN